MEKINLLMNSSLTIFIIVVLVEIIYFILKKLNKIKYEKGIKEYIVRIILVIFCYEFILFILMLVIKFKDLILNKFLSSNSILRNTSEFILSPTAFLILFSIVEIYKISSFNGKIQAYFKAALPRFYYLITGYILLSFLLSYLLMHINNICFESTNKVKDTFSRPLTSFIIIFVILCFILWKLIVNKKVIVPLVKLVLVLLALMIVLIEYYISGRILVSFIGIIFFGSLIFGILNRHQ